MEEGNFEAKHKNGRGKKTKWQQKTNAKTQRRRHSARRRAGGRADSLAQTKLFYICLQRAGGREAESWRTKLLTEAAAHTARYNNTSKEEEEDTEAEKKKKPGPPSE